MGLEIAPEDVGNRPDKADFVLESFWLAHGDTLLTVTDIVHVTVTKESSEPEKTLVRLTDCDLILWRGFWTKPDLGATSRVISNI